MQRWLRRQGISLRRPSGHRRSNSATGIESGEGDYNESLLQTDGDEHGVATRSAPSRARSATAGAASGPASPPAAPASPSTPGTTAGTPASPLRASGDIVAQLFDAIIHDNVDLLFAVLDCDPNDHPELNPPGGTRTCMNTQESGGSLNVNSTFGQGERPILHVAASLGAHDCLCALVRHGADVDCQDGAGTTAVHLAARNGHRNCIESLVVHFKADLAIADAEGFTAVHWLASNGRTSHIEFLLGLLGDGMHGSGDGGGPPVDFEDHNGTTALQVTCHGGHTDCASYLLSQGADVNKVDHFGRSSLWYASKCGGLECCELLLRHGAKLLSDKDNRDAFHITLVEGHALCAARLTVAFPQLLARLVTEASKQTHTAAVVTEALSLVSRSNAATMRATVEALSHLTATMGMQLLCLGTPEEQTGESFIRLIKVTQQLLLPGVSPKADKALQLQQVRSISASVLSPVWEALEDWLHLVADELSEQQGRGSCYSPSCTGGVAMATADDSAHDSVNGSSASASGAAAPATGGAGHPDQNSSNFPSVGFAAARSSSSSPSSSAGGSASGAAGGGGAQGQGRVPDESSEPVPQRLCYSASCTATRKRRRETAAASAAAAGNGASGGRTGRQNGSYERVDFEVGPSQGSAGSIATRSASRIVRMIYAYYLIHHNVHADILDHGIHSFFTRHRRVIRWLILRDVSIVFRQLNFILGHSCLLHLISDVIRGQPFEIRRKWFYQHLGGAKPPVQAPGDAEWTIPVLTVPRTNVFENSCALFLNGSGPAPNKRMPVAANGHPTTYQHKRPFAVQFEGEPALGDGVKREWFSILTREILDPNYALFVPSDDQTTYQPNPNSEVNPDHLAYFEFAGSIIGLAIFHRFPLAVHFTRSFYKHMLAKPASYLDAASLDPQYMQSINWILENDIGDAGLDLSFSTETQSFGKTERVELLPGGADIAVTDENKQGYVQLLVAQKLSGAIKAQIKGFTTGLWSFVPRSLLSLFDEYELELLISGIPEIDVEDWQRHCKYSGYSEDAPTVKMFWDVIRSFEQPERALVLQFSTGSSRLPIGGFAHLGGDDGQRRFTLSMDQNESRLPTASTCFNILRLPSYGHHDVLREKLLMAIRDAPEGFAFS